MCMILDANMWGDFLKPTQDMQPIHRWLKKQNGKLVYSDYQTFETELTQQQKEILKRHKQNNKARFIPEEEVQKATNQIEAKHQLKSNDTHILGLAKASQTTILCTKDQNLHKDFTNIIRGGKIYQKESHKHLLSPDACP